MMPRRLSHALLAVGLAALVGGTAAAQDDYFRELSKRYDELSKNHDDDANRERRYVLLDLFPYRTEKACRKLLKDAFDEEKTVDNRVAVVHVLGGSGEPKDLDFLLGEMKKERFRSPLIAIGEALSFTPDAQREEMSKRALKHLGRAKGDLRVSLLEGLGHLAHGDAFDTLDKLDKLTPEEAFERNVALGRCGGERAVETLSKLAADIDPAMRLSAVHGLAGVRSDAAWEAVRNLLLDPAPQVVRAAAKALADGDRKESAADIAEALDASPELRSKEDLRQALVTLLGKDMGHDAAAWKALAANGSAKAPAQLPTYPSFFGAPVASDRVTVLIDTSGSMKWMERLPRALAGVESFLGELPDTTAFAVADISRTFEPFREGGLVTGAENVKAAQAWTSELLTRRGLDVRTGLEQALERYPGTDTICLATDSHPSGASREEESRETMETFRRLNRSHGVRLVICLVMPGGRYEPSERSEAEIDERRDYLRELAEESGGVMVELTE